MGLIAYIGETAEDEGAAFATPRRLPTLVGELFADGTPFADGVGWMDGGGSWSDGTFWSDGTRWVDD